MIVFGIDPGSVVTGYGVVASRRGRFHFVDAGCIRTRSSEPMGVRLERIHSGLVEQIRKHSPDEIAIEEIFRGKSSESALRLGQARGVAILAAAQCGQEAVPYNNQTVKRTVGAHGRADKDALARVVCMLLGTKDLKLPTDATDALAIAITHGQHARARRVLT